MARKKNPAKKEKEVILERNHKEWLELCDWIERNIFNYHVDKGVRLQQKACFVLDGLRKGQIKANNFHETNGEYPLEVILMTFKANKNLILNAIQGKSFDTEEGKMRYICAIVRNKLNDTYERYLEVKAQEERFANADLSSWIPSPHIMEYKHIELDPEKEKMYEEYW